MNPIEFIADNLVSTYSSEYRDTRVGIRKVVEQAVKDIVYTRKDEIIEKCVAQASAELVRKGIVKLMEGIK